MGPLSNWVARMALVMGFERREVERTAPIDAEEGQELPEEPARFSDVEVDPGGGPIVKAQHASPAGDDSHPLASDYAVVVELPRTGGSVVLGYIDSFTAPEAEPGGKRIYSRAEGEGVVASIYLAPSGTITLQNAAGARAVLNDDGTIVVNDVVFEGGNVLVPGNVIAKNYIVG